MSHFLNLRTLANSSKLHCGSEFVYTSQLYSWVSSEILQESLPSQVTQFLQQLASQLLTVPSSKAFDINKPLLGNEDSDSSSDSDFQKPRKRARADVYTASLKSNATLSMLVSADAKALACLVQLETTQHIRALFWSLLTGSMLRRGVLAASTARPVHDEREGSRSASIPPVLHSSAVGVPPPTEVALLVALVRYLASMQKAAWAFGGSRRDVPGVTDGDSNVTEPVVRRQLALAHSLAHAVSASSRGFARAVRCSTVSQSGVATAPEWLFEFSRNAGVLATCPWQAALYRVWCASPWPMKPPRDAEAASALGPSANVVGSTARAIALALFAAVGEALRHGDWLVFGDLDANMFDSFVSHVGALDVEAKQFSGSLFTIMGVLLPLIADALAGPPISLGASFPSDESCAVDVEPSVFTTHDIAGGGGDGTVCTVSSANVTLHDVGYAAAAGAAPFVTTAGASADDNADSLASDRTTTWCAEDVLRCLQTGLLVRLVNRRVVPARGSVLLRSLRKSKSASYAPKATAVSSPSPSPIHAIGGTDAAVDSGQPSPATASHGGGDSASPGASPDPSHSDPDSDFDAFSDNDEGGESSHVRQAPWWAKPLSAAHVAAILAKAMPAPEKFKKAFPADSSRKAKRFQNRSSVCETLGTTALLLVVSLLRMELHLQKRQALRSRSDAYCPHAAPAAEAAAGGAVDSLSPSELRGIAATMKEWALLLDGDDVETPLYLYDLVRLVEKSALALASLLSLSEGGEGAESAASVHPEESPSALLDSFFVDQCVSHTSWTGCDV